MYNDIPGKTGLANLGNTCYINSCMQCISHIYELNTFLNIPDIKNKLNNNVESLLLTEWKELVNMMWNKNCIISPNRFISCIKHIANFKKQSLFTNNAQNDMQEFLIFLLSCFHNALSRKVIMQITGEPTNSTDILAVTCYKYMKETYSNDYSEIINLFYGTYVSNISCIETDDILSCKPEAFSILNIPIPNINRKITLLDCIECFCEKERLENTNAWFDDTTNSYKNVDKYIVFWNLPDILIILLSKWNIDGTKNNNYISIPLENLDLNKYIIGYNNNSYIYNLFAVCNHYGGTDGGHYTANCMQLNNTWCNYNDTHVTDINTNEIISNNAYVLFYRKIK